MYTFIDKVLNLNYAEKLNSLTKYPSILTYHDLGDKGTLKATLVEGRNFKDTIIYITEKIDGTNSRIVFSTNDKGEVEDYIIGSREEFLTAYKDRVHNDKLGIVETVKPIADTIMLLTEGQTPETLNPNTLYVLYGETYGGATKMGKNYSSEGNYDFRVFDYWEMKLDDVFQLLEENQAYISTWRDKGNQPFKPVPELADFVKQFNLKAVPYRTSCSGNLLPTELRETLEWMKPYSQTIAPIDNINIDNKTGVAEGVVIRTEDRSLIRKLRFKEYNKTIMFLNENK